MRSVKAHASAPISRTLPPHLPPRHLLAPRPARVRLPPLYGSVDRTRGRAAVRGGGHAVHDRCPGVVLRPGAVTRAYGGALVSGGVGAMVSPPPVPHCRGKGGLRRERGCRCCNRSGGGPPASRDAHGRGRHSAAQRTCARRARRLAHRWACGTDHRATRRLWSSWARRNPEVAARGRQAQLGAVGGHRGAGAVSAL